MKNYFRHGKDVKFFDDEVVEQTVRAYYWYKARPGSVLFKPCRLDGPWNGAPLVGHRALGEITADLKAAMEAGDVAATIARVLEHEAYTERFERC